MIAVSRNVNRNGVTPDGAEGMGRHEGSARGADRLLGFFCWTRAMRLLRYSWYVCLITLVGLLLASTSFSQTLARAGRKIALLVGVRVYRGDAGLGNLKYPENDV